MFHILYDFKTSISANTLLKHKSKTYIRIYTKRIFIIMKFTF